MFVDVTLEMIIYSLKQFYKKMLDGQYFIIRTRPLDTSIITSVTKIYIQFDQTINTILQYRITTITV